MIAVKADGLSKSYSLQNEGSKAYQALENISFELKEGESLGIIGRNGAGKSTLLKLLTGVTFPTSGEAKIEGTFSSLLEVGTGFHPDLNGRDNIFLNASILGISKNFVHAELANIISFSGVENFIDQPLRTYSSGMRLRLAFAIIAHLNTDIIALDEVLTVGDSMFQIKCMQRIFDFKKEGRSILFVSHNLGAVQKLCERTIVLKQGKIVFDGETAEAIKFYQQQNTAEFVPAQNNLLQSIECQTSENNCSLKLVLKNLPSDSEVDLGVNISTESGQSLYHFSNRFNEQQLAPEGGALNLEVAFKHSLKPGNYSVAVYVGQDEKELLWQENAAQIIVPSFNPYGFHNPDSIQGPILAEFNITTS
ncbi:MAG: ABC-type polysaccharide/polyol phosphate transport system ATPase subunit [Bacteroidia bacterium]|jgi:ABC-type polysaccharide/polyol phosphate transport system ATPase subunit